MPIFNETRDYQRFIKTMFYYQLEGPKPKFSAFIPDDNILYSKEKIVEIICYCLMPNHFHFLLKQIRNNGISELIGKLSNSYTKYFNTKNKRVGPLFQGQFKAVHVETNDQLLHLSRYIHLNPLINYVIKDINAYTWSSYHEYTDRNDFNFCSKEIVLDQFKSPKDYEQFIYDQIDYAKQLETIKHQLIDFEN